MHSPKRGNLRSVDPERNKKASGTASWARKAEDPARSAGGDLYPAGLQITRPQAS